MTYKDKTDDLKDLFEDVTGTTEVTEEQEMDERRSSPSDDEQENEEANERALPTIEATCDECGNDTAYYYLQQTRAADESETRFYICTECENKWRDYD